MNRRRTRAARAREFLSTYTHDLTARDVQQLFTRDTREAYAFFTRGTDPSALDGLPWRKRVFAQIRVLFLAFTLKLSPARRLIYGLALICAVIGLLQSLQGIGMIRLPVIPLLIRISVPGPVWPSSTLWLFAGFAAVNLLVLLEVADRLSLKNDLEIAREIQLAMLPHETFKSADIEASGLTRPANTVGGDFFDIQRLPDDRVALALGDVAGKGSPAALLMALLLAMLRTLLDERLDPAALLARLNSQVARHAPGSRFITLFFAIYDPASGRLIYSNAGHLPPLIHRVDHSFTRLTEGGLALGLFETASYHTFATTINPGDTLLLYSDGLTEAEDPGGRPFDEAGLENVLLLHPASSPSQLSRVLFDAVSTHAQADRFADDLTVLVLRRERAAVAAPVAAAVHGGA
jgi:sigma-B regulation protein RsbU (phosphoserine phosphatase)